VTNGGLKYINDMSETKFSKTSFKNAPVKRLALIVFILINIPAGHKML
jgi:hypothetical protein